jgi:hypothetical protein
MMSVFQWTGWCLFLYSSTRNHIIHTQDGPMGDAETFLNCVFLFCAILFLLRAQSRWRLCAKYEATAVKQSCSLRSPYVFTTTIPPLHTLIPSQAMSLLWSFVLV